MSEVLDILRERHEALLVRKLAGQTGAEIVEDVRSFVADVQNAGVSARQPAERSQLRAYLRFWGRCLYEETGVFPSFDLLPPRGGLAAGPTARRDARVPSWAWFLLGVVVTVLVVGLGSLLYPPAVPQPAPGLAPTATRPVLLGQIELGMEIVDGSRLDTPREVFCAGTTHITGQFQLSGIRPGDLWYWELHPGRQRVIASSESPWNSTLDVAFHPLLTDDEGIAPGLYTLRVYVNGWLQATKTFRVLGSPPRIEDLRVTSVSGLLDPSAPRRTEFPPETEAVYVGYDFAGLCPGANVSLSARRDGEIVAQSTWAWGGAVDGQDEWLVAPEEGLRAGRYTVEARVDGVVQARSPFTVPTPAPVSLPPEPHLGGLLVAQGVEWDGIPVGPGTQFEWNTRALYAIFSYADLPAGAEWAVVWSRGGDEVGRSEGTHRPSDPASGTAWGVYTPATGQYVPGGDYTVSLYLGESLQATADARVRFYVAP